MTALEFDNLIAGEKTFGLDISSSRIKSMWVVERGNGTMTLKGFGMKPLPASAIVGGVVRRQDVVAEAIRESIFNASPKPIKTPYAVCSIPQEKVLVNIESFPNIEKEKLRQAVQYQANKILGMPLDKVYWDWHRLDVDKKKPTVDILIAAVEKDVVDSYIDTILQAGVIPLALEMDVSAAARLILAGAKREDQKKPVILVNIGNSHSAIAIYHGGGVRFTSSLTIGGNQLTKSISTHLKQSLSEAVTYMRATGLQSESETLVSELKTILSPLGKEIQDAIAFYDKSSGKSDSIGRILLHGDGAILKGVEKFLQQEYFPNLRVEHANPKLKLVPIPQFITHEKIYPHIVITGLALRGFSIYKGLEGINLLPESAKSKYVSDLVKRKINALAKVFTINALALAMFLFGSWYLLKEKSREVDGIIQVKESVLRAERIQGIREEIEVLNTAVESVSTLINVRLDWIKVADQLLLAVPDDITLTNVDISIDETNKNGEPKWTVGIFGKAPDKQSVIDFSNELLTKDVFDNVNFPVSNFSTGEEGKFQVNAEMSFSNLLKNPELFKKAPAAQQELELKPIQGVGQ